MNAAGLNHCATVSAPFGSPVRWDAGLVGADVVVGLPRGERAAGPRAVDAAHRPAAENRRGYAVLQHLLTLAERQFDDEVGDEAMTDVEVARAFPRFEIARVLRAARRGIEVLGGLVTRFADGVRRA